jgi:hypothetical protein
MIDDILYSSAVILAQTEPIVTGSGTTAVIYDPFIVGTTTPFTTGSGTLVQYQNMIDFIPTTRSANLTSGSVLTYTFDSLAAEEIDGVVLGPTSMPAGNPYKETIIIK